MNVSRISGAASNAVKKLGSAIIDNGQTKSAASKALCRVNNLVQGEGINPGRPAYYFLMSGCVIVPRLIQAREPDEFREIFTRDIITVLTILFAMKGLKSGMCQAAQKKGGVILVNDTVGKNANPLKKLGGYLNPEGGISALSSNEILARYSNIKDKDTLVKTLSTVDKEGGNVAKMFAIEKQEGIVSKLMKKLPFGKKNTETPLYDAAKKMLGSDFETKTNGELIEKIKNISTKDTVALEGLEEIVGSSSFNGGAGHAVKKGILNNPDNPITTYARNISANFEWLSLGLTAGFLGFGLPKLNEQTTMKRHLQGPNRNTIEKKMTEKAETKQFKTVKTPADGTVYRSIQANGKNKIFKNFIA